MKRSLFPHLEQWLLSKRRKPLLVLGARQIGKTYLIRTFGSEKFSHTHELNFQATTSLHKIFKQDLEPKELLRNIELALERSIDPSGKELLFFDEIQDCPEALTALKYFQEQMPHLPIVAAGSLLGLHLASSSFPVGKVDVLHLYPLSFGEYLQAAGTPKDWEIYQESCIKPLSLPPIAHERFWNLFKSYLVTGGLPEPVQVWIENGGFKGGLKAFQASRDKLSTIISAYGADIAKHSGKVNALHIERIWRNVPQQLAQSLDGATARFKFKDVVPGIASYRDLAGPIDWLVKAGLVLRIPVAHSAERPINVYTQENIFKLYAFDSGVLGSIIGATPKTIMNFDFGTYKGFFVENFVAQELIATNPNPVSAYVPHAWSEGRAEIEFVLDTEQGILPVEVKSGNKVKAKSLQSFIQRYNPSESIVLSARPPSEVVQGGTRQINLPLFLVPHLWRRFE